MSRLPQCLCLLTAWYGSCFLVSLHVLWLVKNRTFKTTWQLWKSDSSLLQGLLFLVLALDFFLKFLCLCWNVPFVYASCPPSLVDSFTCILVILMSLYDSTIIWVISKSISLDCFVSWLWVIIFYLIFLYFIMCYWTLDIL